MSFAHHPAVSQWVQTHDTRFWEDEQPYTQVILLFTRGGPWVWTQVIHHEEMNTLESVVDAALYKVLVVSGLALPSAGNRRSQAKGAPRVPP